MTLDQIKNILSQAEEAGVDWIYFEGGEPSLYYTTVLRGVKIAKQKKFQVGMVTNGYWAISQEDAVEFLRPFARLLNDLSISNDLYHYSDLQNSQAKNAIDAAGKLGISVGEICVAQPEDIDAAASVGKLPEGGSAVMYRGRAVKTLVPRAATHPWNEFITCPHENLRDPGRCHLDPFGNLHICQGVSLGNIFHTPLKELCNRYSPESHPVCGPLLEGGPVALIEEYNLPHKDAYADACHLCYDARSALRSRFPDVLLPDQMYGCED